MKNHWIEKHTEKLNNAANLKGSQLLSDYDILTKWLKYSEDEAQQMLRKRDERRSD